MGITTDPQTNDLILIMEYMKDGSLEDLLFKQKVKLSHPDVLRLALDIAKGIHYLHSQNPKILHRDLKSANVLVTILNKFIRANNFKLHSGKKRAKISDFGTAKFLPPNAKAETVIGAVGIALPPEMLVEKPYDEKVDIFSYVFYHTIIFDATNEQFSFGVVLYEMFTNTRMRVLDESDRQEFIKNKINHDEMTQLLVLNCCMKDPTQRPTTLQVITTLKQIRKATKS